MKLHRFLLYTMAAFCILLLTSNDIPAEVVGCSSNNEAAVTIITDAQIGLDLKNKLLAKVNDAWRTYQSGKINSKSKALKVLTEVLNLINSPATKQIPPATKATILAAIQGLRDCLAGAPSLQMATLTLRALQITDEANPPVSAGAGVIINIDGTEFGSTGPDGTVTLQVPARTINVEARRYPSQSGEVSISVMPNETKSVDIVMEDGKDVSEDSTLVFDQVQDGILNRNFTEATLRFTKNDLTAPLSRLDLVALLDPNGGASTFVTNMFALQTDGKVDGGIRLNNLSAFKNLLLLRTGVVMLNVHGVDNLDRIYDRTIEFYVSQFKVTGHLAAPPSFPGLNTAGIAITATILNTSLIFNTLSDSSGNFEFSLLPPGNLEFTSETLQNGKYYYGQGILVLDSNKTLTVNMLNTVDLANGVPPFIVSSQNNGTVKTVSSVSRSLPIDESTGRLNEKNDPVAAARASAQAAFIYDHLLQKNTTDDPVFKIAASNMASVSVTAGQQNVPVTQTATLDVPKGTKSVNLTYKVSTAEYPTFVLAQSIFNDTWSLAVRIGGSGQQLFSISRQINSQLSLPPVWQSDGSTGEITVTIPTVTIPIGTLAASEDIQLVLFASAMNVGDSILPTSVQATLGGEGKVKINSMTPDSSVPFNFHSIPRPGEKNVAERFFTLKITRPEGSTIKKVTVKLMGPDELMTIVDNGPGPDVTEVDEQTLRVRVSLHTNASQIDSQPPPTHIFKYKFKLVVDDKGTEMQDEKTSGDRRALWRMPDGFARYSTRVTGGDNWCSRGTYNWLATNALLITKINHISGEHGRNIGHMSHKFGTDIDIFHFYEYGPTLSGGQTYQRLKDDVVLAIQTDSTDPIIKQKALEAKARVTAWVSQTHTGLDNLAAQPEVIELRYILGAKTAALPLGWGSDLLKTGKTTVNGQVLDVGTGSWTNSRYMTPGDHDDHIHITLSRTALQE